MNAKESVVKQVVDEEGRLVWNITDYNGHIYAPFCGDLVERIESYKKSFPVRDDDIYLVNYPKSGTHWLRGILSLLVGQKEYKWQQLEIDFDPQDPFPQGAARRIINTHLRYDDMPPAILRNTKAKMIQIHRNPADVAVSFYHQKKNGVKENMLSYEWDEFITKLFCDKQKMIQGTWFDYTCEWWTHCNKNPNYLPVFFEELKKEPMEIIAKIAEFIEVQAGKDLIQRIADQTSFQKMKEMKQLKEAVELKPFFVKGFSIYRNGIVGDWRNHFTKEQHQKFMEYYNQELQDFPELRHRHVKHLHL